MNRWARRSSLLATTALVLAAVPALAQTLPAPTELPTGMRVIAGQASASTHGAQMQVTQQSGRAALDWSSFNIGSQAGVHFQTPGQQATTLNRVSGPNASVIAGRLSSNGQLVLINQSGVVFMPGAVVDAQSVVVSAAGITEQAMRAGVASGHFVLNQPARPGARIVNNGRISVRRAGLAALVAPQVANHGIISAPFGTVKLAGVTRHVVDLYGDGLLSIDVSRQTIKDAAGDSELVTNDGAIEAEGGRVTLSTAAVDGIVTNLVEAGGSISADSTGRHGGRVLIDAEGGIAQVSGTMTARGSVGGQIGIMASQEVNVAGGARIDASGTRGGGTVAIGTTLARARGGVGVKAPAAKLVAVQPGASIVADALDIGDGGHVTVLSTDNTLVGGTLSSRGGALSGNGGIVEVSGTLGLTLIGRVDVTAAHGHAGGLVIDPTNLIVQTGGSAVLTNGELNVAPPPPNHTATIDPNVLEAASGNVTLISTDNLNVKTGFSLNSNGLLTMTATNGTMTVAGAITNSGGGIVMTAGGNIFIDAAITSAGSLSITSTNGAITQQAGAPVASTGSTVTLSALGDINMGAAVTADGFLSVVSTRGAVTQQAGAPVSSTASGILFSAAGVISLGDAVSATNAKLGSVDFGQNDGVVQTGGSITTPALFGSGTFSGNIALTQSGNSIDSLGNFGISQGGFTLVDAKPLSVVGSLQVFSASPVSLTAPRIAIGRGGSIVAGANGGGLVELGPTAGGAVTLGSDSGTGFALTNADLNSIRAGVLRIGAANGSATASTVTIAAPFGANGPDGLPVLELVSSGGITVNADLIANTLLLGGSGAVTQGAGAAATVAAAALGSSSAFPLSGSVTLANPLNALPALGAFSTTGSNVDVATSGSLNVAGPVSTSGGALTLDAAGGGITLAGNVSVGNLSLTTGSGGDVAQNAGAVLSASGLAGSVAGSVALVDSFAGTTNVGPLSAQTISLQTAGVMNIASAVTGFDIDLTAAALTEDVVNGSLNGATVNDVFQGVLTSSGGIGGDATLTGRNTLTAIEGFTTGGTLSLLNARSLTITCLASDFGCSGVGASSALFHVTNGGLIDIASPLTIPAAGSLVLQADDLAVGLKPPEGVTTAPIALIAVAPDTALQVQLGGSAVSSTGTLGLGSNLLATFQAGTLQFGGLPDGTISAASIVVAGAVFGAATTLLLDTTGNASQTAALAAGTLGGQIGGDLALITAGNSIGALGNLSVGGNAALADTASALAVTGAVTLIGGGLLQIATDGFSFAAGGSIGAGTGTVEIGPVSAGQAVIIGGGASGAITLGDLSRITAATLQAGRSGLAIGQDAFAVVLGGNANFGGTMLLDAGAGGVVQSSGALTATALGGSSGGVFDIAGGGANAIGQLLGIGASSVDVTDTRAVRVSGVVQAATGPLNLTAPSISIDSAGQLVAVAGTVGLTTDALTSPRTSAVQAFSTVDITPDTLATLTVGPVAGAIDLSRITTSTIDLFSGTGGIVFTGAVAPGAATLILSAAGAPVSETAADSLTVGTLSGIAGSLSMPGANAIGTLAGFSVGLGNFLLADANLTVTGAVQGSNVAAAQSLTIKAPVLTLATGASFSTAFSSPASALTVQADTLNGAVNATVPGGTVLIERLTAGAQSFAQSGGITAGTLQVGSTLTSTSLSLGTLSNLAVAALHLESSGAISQTGAIAAPGATLTGVAGSANLDNGGNIIATLGNFSTTGNGAFALTDSVPLTVTGAVLAGSGSLALIDQSPSTTGFGLTLAAGSQVQGGAVSLVSPFTQGVTQDPAGSLTAASLSGTLGANLLLDGTNNAIDAINALFVGGLLRMSDQASLGQSPVGVLSAGTLAGTFGGDVRLLSVSNTIGTLGPISAAGTLELTAAAPTVNGLVQASAISFAVDGLNYLSGSVVATGAPIPGPLHPLFATSGTVEIGPRTASVLNLGAASGGAPFVSAGVLANINAAVLVLGRSIDGPTATGIAVNAPVSVSSALPPSQQVATVDLESVSFPNFGPVTEAAGATFTIPGTLTGNTGAVSLLSPGNVIPAIGPYIVTGGGSFALSNAGPLAIEGSPGAPTASGIIAANITLATTGALTLDTGSLFTIGGAGTVDLTADGASEVNGIINAATLDSSGTPSGNFALAGANVVGTLGAWNATGALTLVTDTTPDVGPDPLVVSGPVTVTALALRAISIELAGDVTVTGGGAADLSTTAGGVTQTAGTLSAGLLTSTAGVVGGPALLTDSGNPVGALGPFSVPGNAFSLNDTSPLQVVGAVSAGSVLLSDAAGITVVAPIAAPLITIQGGTLAINQNGSLVAQGGSIDLVLTGATETGNGFMQAATLFSDGTPSGAQIFGGANQIGTLGAFQMASGGSLLLADSTALTVAGPVSADSVALSATGITLAGLVSAGVVDLSASKGGVIETTGAIVAGLLQSSGNIAGGATLENAGNAVASIGNILVTSGDFRFAQPGSLGVSGTVSAANITARIGGALQIASAGTLAASGTVDLGAADATEASTGAIVAAVFESTQGASGVFDLNGANRIADLGPFAIAGGTLSLADGQALNVSGPVTANALDLQATDITLAGTLTAQQVNFVTTSAAVNAGNVIQTAGAINSGLLTGKIIGELSLKSAANQIGNLGSLSAAGGIVLSDTGNLGIVGPVTTFSAQLAVAGFLGEAQGGSLVSSVLSGQAGVVALTQPGNFVSSLNFETTQGAFDLVNQQSLVVAALSSNGASLSVAGDLILAGSVSEGVAPLSLNVSGNVTQSGGSLSTALLEGSAASISLPNGNFVAALGNITAPGGLTLANAVALAIPGVVRAGLIDLSIASGGISEPGGALIANQLVSSHGIAGDALLTGANQVAALGPLADSGRFQLVDTQALAVGNVSAATLDLSTSAGGINENGPVSTGLLTSSAGIIGGARFDDAGNQVAVLGAMPVSGGDLFLTTAGGLRITGPVNAPNFTLRTGGAVAQTGAIVVPGTFSTTSYGPYQRTSGALVVGTLTGRAVSNGDFGGSAQVQRIGAFTVNDVDDGFPGASEFSYFSLMDATALTLAGPLPSDYIRISATGTLIWAGDITTLGLPRLQQVGPAPSDPGTWLQVLAGPNGTAQLLQTGVAHVFSQDALLSTVRIQFPPVGGSVSFNNLQAPNTDILLFLGAGRATGLVNLGDLFVSGTAGGANLSGSVQGLVGEAAAHAADIDPFLNANYLLNSCPLRTVSCILLPLYTVPAENPLRDIAIGQATDELDDADVLLPNVAEQDY